MRVRGLWLLWVTGLFWLWPQGSWSITRLEFLGEARVPGGTRVGETPVGGLSGLAYDERSGLYYAVADDPSTRGPARFFTLEIDLAEGRLASDGVRMLDMRVIQAPAGGPMPELSLDPEGIVVLDSGEIFISSEGQVHRGVAPFVRRFDSQGSYLGELPLPQRYRPSSDGTSGPRRNLVFESLTATPDGRHLFTALENALIEDGPQATIDGASPARMLRFDLATGELAAEHLYWVEPVAEPASVADGLEVAGLVELLALEESRLLALERSFSMGRGNTIRLYLIDTVGATDLRALGALGRVDLATVTPVRKSLLLDLAELDRYLDNVEGMTFGPALEDGRRTLILVSDDNFNPLVQTTQFLAFALGEGPVSIDRLQGAGHRSPWTDQWVRGIAGVVTGHLPGEDPGFWIEDPAAEGSPASSRGVFVTLDDETELPAIGTGVTVDGRVRERQRPGDLSVTEIDAARVTTGAPMQRPEAVLLGRAGRRVPAEVIDDDRLRIFEPEFDGLDFWESLEGMRVEIRDARVVGPTNRYGDFVIDARGRPTSEATTVAGGLLLRPGDGNPERLTVDFTAVGEPPHVDVGDRFSGPLQGIIDYRYGTYRLCVQPPVAPLVSAGRQSEATVLRSGEQRLTVATFNVLNLSALSARSHVAGIAATLVDGLASPDIVALQEIQDDNGPEDDGTVSAGATLQRLIDAVVAAGGPRYEARQIDPLDNRDGGRPGANIRPAFLFNPTRVDFVDRQQVGSADGARWLEQGGRVELSANPGRLAPHSPAFNGDEARGFSASRKPLVAEFRFGSERLVVINNHWSSKGPDDGAMGEVQPPIRHSEDQRAQQARLVADFVADLMMKTADVSVIVLGDLNEHEFRTPLRLLTEVPLENLVYRVPAAERYSFVYRGNSQLLDHILIGPMSRARVRFDIVHAHADFAASRAASDHDPMLIELDFSSAR